MCIRYSLDNPTLSSQRKGDVCCSYLNGVGSREWPKSKMSDFRRNHAENQHCSVKQGVLKLECNEPCFPNFGGAINIMDTLTGSVTGIDVVDHKGTTKTSSVVKMLLVLITRW